MDINIGVEMKVTDGDDYQIASSRNQIVLRQTYNIVTAPLRDECNETFCQLKINSACVDMN